MRPSKTEPIMNLSKIRGSTQHGHIQSLNDGYIKDDESESHANIIRKALYLKSGGQLYIQNMKKAGASALILECMKDRTNKMMTLDSASIVGNTEEIKNILRRSMRSTMNVVFKEQLKIVEGEVVSITEDKIVLKTVDMESAFEIGARIQQELKRARVIVGDIIKVYKESGYVCKLGRSLSQRTEVQSAYLPQMALPEGECFKMEKTTTNICLYEIDLINLKESAKEGLYSGDEMIPENISKEADEKIVKMIRENKAEINKGVLVIENAHLLPDEILRFINLYKNSELSPAIILIGRKIPSCIENNLIVLRLSDINYNKAMNIIKKRAEYIGCAIENEILEYLASMVKNRSIEYVLNLLELVNETKANNLEAIYNLEKMFEPFSVKISI